MDISPQTLSLSEIQPLIDFWIAVSHIYLCIWYLISFAMVLLLKDLFKNVFAFSFPLFLYNNSDLAWKFLLNHHKLSGISPSHLIDICCSN